MALCKATFTNGTFATAEGPPVTSLRGVRSLPGEWAIEEVVRSIAGIAGTAASEERSDEKSAQRLPRPAETIPRRDRPGVLVDCVSCDPGDFRAREDGL